jgi:O-antigen ligase
VAPVRTASLHALRPAVPGKEAAAPVALAVAGALVGVLTARQPLVAALLVVGVGLVFLVASNVAALTIFLTATMFLESLALGPGVRIGRIAGLMAIVVLSLYILVRGTGLQVSPLLLVACAYGVWLLGSGLWATSGSYVATYFSKWALSAAYMLAFAVLVRTRRHIAAVFATLAVGALIVGAISFLGYISHGAQYLASGKGATGLQGDHNYFAVYQSIALPAVLTLAALERRRGLRLVYYAAVATIGLSVVASLSRTGLFALAGVVVVTLLVPSRLFFRRRTQKMSYLVALIGVAAIVSVSGSTPFLARVQSIWQAPAVAGHAGSGRVDLWRAAWRAYTEHPVLGLGAGNFQAHSIELVQQTPGADQSADYAQRNFVVHNMYLETLTDLGPVGLAILLGLLVLTGRTFLSVFRRARDRGDRALQLFAVAPLVSLIAYCIGGFFLSIEFNKPLWILVGLALAFDVISRRTPAAAGPEPAVDPRVPAASAPEPPSDGLARRRALLAVRERRLRRLRAAGAHPADVLALESALQEQRDTVERGVTARGRPAT